MSAVERREAPSHVARLELVYRIREAIGRPFPFAAAEPRHSKFAPRPPIADDASEPRGILPAGDIARREDQGQ